MKWRVAKIIDFNGRIPNSTIQAFFFNSAGYEGQRAVVYSCPLRLIPSRSIKGHVGDILRVDIKGEDRPCQA